MNEMVATLLALHEKVRGADGKTFAAAVKEFDARYKRTPNREQSEFHWRLANRCPGEFGNVHLVGCDCA